MSDFRATDVERAPRCDEMRGTGAKGKRTPCRSKLEMSLFAVRGSVQIASRMWVCPKHGYIDEAEEPDGAGGYKMRPGPMVLRRPNAQR
jgi:hypothetical protein